ncbi:MAG TPA: hypothetical protein VK686_03260 [Bryobacteraceae bacterium]|jgi:hypothetical protein|nr:hypothetical protein [Bryobacteraceae bacterium]
MNYKLSCSIFLLASAAVAQTIMPGTLASAVVPDSAGGASSSSSSSDARQPITARERIDWVVKGTIGPDSLAAGLFSAGFGTLINSPKTYGPHWEGFGDRYGMRLSGIAASNTVEAGLGAIWGEDPRYNRAAGAPFSHRLGHAAKMTFMAQDRDGNLMPAYARLIAIPGTNFLSNTWRASGDDTADRAAIRTGLGFLGRFGGNTFDEFWPDVHRKLFHRNRSSDEALLSK